MYQFKKKSDDEYILECNGKEYPFTRTIDIAREMQSVDLETTFIVSEFLAERGETYDDTKLRITKTKGNQTIVDESNLKRLEEKARNMAYNKIIDNVFMKTFNMGYLKVLNILDIKTSDEQAIIDFSSKFTEIIINGIPDDTPSEQDTQDNRETE